MLCSKSTIASADPAAGSPPTRHICRRLGTATSDACRPRLMIGRKYRVSVPSFRSAPIRPHHGTAVANGGEQLAVARQVAAVAYDERDTVITRLAVVRRVGLVARWL
jgi:hypothetical protein